MKRNIFTNVTRYSAAKAAAAVAALFIVSASTVWAQSTILEEGNPNPTRYPDTGIAIIDCAAKAPAPKNSCVVRVPPHQKRGTLRRLRVGDEKAEFKFVRPGAELFPKDLTLSETIVLIDLTPGPRGGRRGTFKAEQKLIRQFVKELPAGERIAIYGFNEKMHRLADFSTDRSVALNAIDALKLTGDNTRISTFAKDAIGILVSRDQAVLKNLFVISDGEEEGVRDAAGVSRAAIKANVSVSALGMFWRKLGVKETAIPMDYLDSLTKDTFGTSVQLQLKRFSAAKKALTKFQSVLNASMQDSGLIVPVGTPRTADIIVPMKVPVSGVEGSYSDRDVKVRFTPAKSDDAEGKDKNAKDGDAEGKEDGGEAGNDKKAMLFGYPALWVYVAAGALVLLLLLLLLLIVRRKKSGDEIDDGLDYNDDSTALRDDFDDTNSQKTQLTPAPAPRRAAVHAYLINSVTRQKLPLSAARVTIGRGNTNAVVLDDNSVSRMHCEITRNREGGYTVSDLDSLNGTFVNGKKLAGVGRIKTGDKIKFGEVAMHFVLA